MSGNGSKIDRSEEMAITNIRNWFKLIFATSLGIFYFMVPLSINGEIQILYSLVTNYIIESLGFVPALVVIIMLVSALPAIFFTLIKRDVRSETIKRLFIVSPKLLTLKVLAAVTSILIYYDLGHPYIYNENTGGLILFYLMPILVISFFQASVLMPLVLDFGGVGIVGAVFKPIFQPLFRLPGSSAILAIGSFLGDGSIGILSTNRVYKKRLLTAKQGAILMFGFCTIPIPYIFIFSTQIGGLDADLFPYLFLTVFICLVVSTAILSRIPPLSKKEDTYYSEENNNSEEEVVEPKLGLKAALKSAANAPSFKEMVVNGSKDTFFLYMDVFPAILLIATGALIIGEFTTVFDILAAPLIPLLKFIGLPEAVQAAPAFIIGYLDLLLPFLIAGDITSQLTKFVISTIGVVQVMCLSETGALAIKTNMNINFWDVTIVVFEKTLFCIPIAFIMGKLIGLS